jgi:hypothetical protein
VKADRGWSRPFEDSIQLHGRQFVTLEDADNYITGLPRAEHMAPEWQTAMQALMIVALGGPTLLVRIGVMRALHRHDVREFTDRKELALGQAEAQAGSVKGRPSSGLTRKHPRL